MKYAQNNKDNNKKRTKNKTFLSFGLQIIEEKGVWLLSEICPEYTLWTKIKCLYRDMYDEKI